MTSFRPPSNDDPHRPFYDHLLAGGSVFRQDSLSGRREWLSLAELNDDATSILRYGHLDLTVPPADASDYFEDGFSIKFYRRVHALGMNLLDYWAADEWKSAGTLPWADLKPVPGRDQTPVELPTDARPRPRL